MTLESTVPESIPVSKQGLTTQLLGSASFRLLKVEIAPNGAIIVEPGLMASQDSSLNCETRINRGLISGLMAKFLGGESFFINIYSNPTTKSGQLMITQATPGEIIQRDLENETIFLESGAFMAMTPGIQSSTVWAGFSSYFAGEGLFRLRYRGTGTLWFGSYGAVIEKDLNGDLLVDSHHLLAYPSTVKWSLKLVGSLFSSLMSREGFVLRLKGTGKIYLQTRSVKGLAQWLNSRFWS